MRSTNINLRRNITSNPGGHLETQIKPRPTLPDVLPLVRRLYELTDSGGPCHIVLDDGNLETSSIDYCLGVAAEAAERDRYGAEVCDLSIKLLGLMRQMTMTQRRKIYNTKWGPTGGDWSGVVARVAPETMVSAEDAAAAEQARHIIDFYISRPLFASDPLLMPHMRDLHAAMWPDNTERVMAAIDRSKICPFGDGPWPAEFAFGGTIDPVLVGKDWPGINVVDEDPDPLPYAGLRARLDLPGPRQYISLRARLDAATPFNAPRITGPGAIAYSVSAFDRLFEYMQG